MSDLFTSRVYQAGKAPARIDLLGEKTKRPESAQHIITFPGGAIELTRTTEGSYWAHILINRDWWLDDQEGFHAAMGEVVDSRIDTGPVVPIEAAGSARQIAVLIKPHRKREAA